MFAKGDQVRCIKGVQCHMEGHIHRKDETGEYLTCMGEKATYLIQDGFYVVGNSYPPSKQFPRGYSLLLDTSGCHDNSKLEKIGDW